MKTASEVYDILSDKIEYYYFDNKKMPTRIYLDSNSFKLLYNSLPEMIKDMVKEYPAKFKGIPVYVVHTDITPYRLLHPEYAPKHIEVA